MLKLIASQAPDLPVVADNSITSSSTDNTASPVQAAFAQLLAEISSPEVLTATVQPNLPVPPSVVPIPENAPDDPARPGNPEPSSSTPNVGAGFTPARAGIKPAPTPESNTTVPVANLMLFVHNPFQVTTGPEVTRPEPKAQTINLQPVPTSITASVEPLHPEALANSIHVEVESATPPANAPAQASTPFVTQLTVMAPEFQQQANQAEPQTPVPTPTAAVAATGTLSSTDTVPAPATRVGVAPAPISVSAEVVTKLAGSSSQKQGSQDSSGDGQKHNLDSSDKTTVSLNPMLSGTTAKFDNHLAAADSARPAVPVREMLEMPTLQSAHKVSIDIGDKDSKVIVTLHERAGDVSVKVHAANDTLKAQLQSSVGSLVESLNRANVSLKNVDFSSGYGTTAQDSDQRNTPQHKASSTRSKSSNNPAKDEAGDSVQLSSV